MVVCIVGVLAVLAVVGYRRLITSSHLTEATGLVNGIRVAQESYHAETGIYATIGSATALAWAGGSPAALCPNPTKVGNFKTGWDPGCGAGNQGPWQNLPLHVDTAVMYGYQTISNSISGASNATTVVMPLNMNNPVTATAPSGEWYSVVAVGDPDGDGVQSAVLGTSVTNQLIVQGDGN